MNNPMKRKEDVNRRGRANLEQTKAGKVEIQREITSREDSRHAPTLQCSKCTLSLSLRFWLMFLQLASRGAVLTKEYFFPFSNGPLLLVSPRGNQLQNFLIHLKRYIHKYKQQTKSVLNFQLLLLILKKKTNMPPFFFLRINMQP